MRPNLRTAARPACAGRAVVFGACYTPGMGWLCWFLGHVDGIIGETILVAGTSRLHPGITYGRVIRDVCVCCGRIKIRGV